MSTLPASSLKVVQFIPLFAEYCHAPFVLSTVITAMDSISEVSSTSVMKPSVMNSPTLLPWFSNSFSLIWGSEGGDLVLSSSGAWFTGLTSMLASSVSALNAERPPPSPGSAVSPAVPVVLSQARKVNVAVPIHSSFGTNLILSASFSKMAASEKSAAAPVSSLRSVQVSPSSAEYCQVPSVLSTPVTAMASGTGSSSSASSSVTEPFITISEMLLPSVSGWSVHIMESLGDCSASNSGA